MTLNEHFTLNSLLAPVSLELFCVDFENNRVRTTAGRPMHTISSKHVPVADELLFKVYTDIREGSLERRRQTTIAQRDAIYSLCVRNKSSGSSDAGFCYYGTRK